MVKPIYSVAPRYTPGSPAGVDDDTARRVAVEERDAHARALTGAMGDAERLRAAAMGLRGIVESMTETRNGWKVYDQLTDEHFVRPDPDSKVHLTCGCKLPFEKAREGLTKADAPDMATCPNHGRTTIPDCRPTTG